MEWWIFWVVMAIGVGIGGAHYGRNGIAWFLIALLLSPLIGFILLAIAGRLGPQPAADAPTPETHVKCPDCRELVRKDARKCRYCGCGLIPQ
jgi:hypothetical protein